MSTSIGKGRRITGMILLNLGGIMLFGSAIAKFAHVPKLVVQMNALGFDGGKLTFIAVLEIISALLFLLPVTRSFGLLMVSSYMGGAISAHVQHGEPFIQPAFVLTLIWVGTWLRHPEILWSFGQAAFSSTSQMEQRRTAAQRV